MKIRKEFKVDIIQKLKQNHKTIAVITKNQEEANNFKEPDWTIKDVTTDLSYKNGHLARYGIPKSFYDINK